MSVSATPPLPPEPIYTLRPHAEEISDVKYLSLAKGHIICGTHSGHLGLWELSSKRETWNVKCDSSVISVNTLLTTNQLLSQCRSCVVDLWDLEKQTKSYSMRINKAGFCKLSVLQANTEGESCTTVHQPSSFGPHCFALAHPEYGKVNIYDSLSQKLVSTLSVEAPDSKGMCLCVDVHCDKVSRLVYVFGGFEDGSVVLWDTRHCQSELTSIKLFTEPVMCMAVDTQRECLIAGSATKAVEKVSFSVREQPHCDKILQKSYSVELTNAGVASVAVRDDGRIFSTGGWDGRIRIFGWKKGKPLAVLNYHTETVNTLTFASPKAPLTDSNLLICGSKDGRVSLWKLY